MTSQLILTSYEFTLPHCDPLLNLSKHIWYQKMSKVAQTCPILSKIMPKLLKSSQNELRKTLRKPLFLTPDSPHWTPVTIWGTKRALKNVTKWLKHGQFGQKSPPRLLKLAKMRLAKH